MCVSGWFHAEQVTQALRDLVDRRPVSEAAIISTCNRTEVYCTTAKTRTAIDWMADYHRMKTAQIQPYL